MNDKNNKNNEDQTMMDKAVKSLEKKPTNKGNPIKLHNPTINHKEIIGTIYTKPPYFLKS